MTSKKICSPIVGSAVFSAELQYARMAELGVINVTDDVNEVLAGSGLERGLVTIFAPGATGVVTCLEYEPGVIEDFRAAIERIAPAGLPYRHNDLLGDGNGHSHVRAGLLGPSLSVPFSEARMLLGTWQSVVLVNCDNRVRNRRLVVQVVGS